MEHLEAESGSAQDLTLNPEVSETLILKSKLLRTRNPKVKVRDLGFEDLEVERLVAEHPHP